jgi:hypothetical protein
MNDLSNMNDLSGVREELDQAVASLDDLRVAMREGQEVDLDAFNMMVAKTCKAAVELPQADAPKVRPQLERLLNGLNEAKAEIEAEQAEIDIQLTDVGGAVDDGNGPILDMEVNGADGDTGSDD